MKLQHDFPLEVRNLFIGCWACWECDQNGQGRGGLSIHHIWGRVSASALNASILCNFCHDKITGSTEERSRYFVRTFRHLENMAQAGLFSFGQSEEVFMKLIWPDVADFLSTRT